MKDKLIKTGHKKGFYRIKACFTVALFGLAAVVVSAVPIGIGFKIAEAEAAEQPTVEVPEEEDRSSEVAPLTF